MLELGQVVRYQDALWRVDFVNDCRAMIVPLSKRAVVITDDEGNERRFDGRLRGVNISPNSVLDVVDDPERAAAELELAEAERELARLRREEHEIVHGKPGGTAPQGVLTQPAQREVGDWKPIAKPSARASGPAPPTGWRWHPIKAMAEWIEFQTPGTLKFDVLTVVDARPGMTTKEIAAALADVATGGAVAACLDRFHKAGVLRRG